MGNTVNLTGKAAQVLIHAASSLGLKAGTEIKLSASQITSNVANSPATSTSGTGSGYLAALGGARPEAQHPDQPPHIGSSDYGGGARVTPPTPDRAPQAASEDTEPQVENDRFTLWLQPQAINGGTLNGERVSIIDPDTEQIIGTTTVDDEGNVLFQVPANKPYHIMIEPDDDDLPLDEQGLESLAHSHLAISFYDTSTLPLPPGIPISVRSNGSSDVYETDEGGALHAQLAPGTYEIEIRGQTFFADTLRGIDLQHESSAPYQFLVEGEDESSDRDIENAREQRLTPSDLEDDLDG